MAYLQGDGSVKFIELNGIEHIEIGEDWAIGEERKKEGKVSDETGFIGKSFTKYGIYMSCLTFVIKNQPITQPEQARFKGEEYVLTQPTDENLSEMETHAILKAEYELCSM